jgi:hypothetical protein
MYFAHCGLCKCLLFDNIGNIHKFGLVVAAEEQSVENFKHLFNNNIVSQLNCAVMNPDDRPIHPAPQQPNAVDNDL